MARRNVQRLQMRGVQTAVGKPVQITSSWFRSGYAHGVSATVASRMPSDPREQTIVELVEHILAIVEDDGQISDEQLRYECGILTGYLASTIA